MAFIDQNAVDSFVAAIKPAIEATAAALSTTAESLWTLGVMKQYVDGIFYAAVTIACLVGLVLCYKWTKVLSKFIKDDGDSGAEVLYIIPGIGFIGLIFGFFSALYAALLHLIVPQYTLIMEVIQKIQMYN